MKKQTSFATKGQRADIGPIKIYRILPNRYADKVASFVFFDHIAPSIRTGPKNAGTGAHPHRGIATLTYILDGEVEHLDSRGNSQKVHSGGIQWMKAGNGILHDEALNPDTLTEGAQIHAFQFWINLPSDIKKEEPEYLAVHSSEVPQVFFPDGSGWLKVIAGTYGVAQSIIPNYLKQFLYHIHLEPKGVFSISLEDGKEAAAFLPIGKTAINDMLFEAGEFVEFDRHAGTIVLENRGDQTIDILLFGGEPYTEPIVAEGPFVMNSHSEIAEAYRDFYAGKYGLINRQSGKV